MIFLAPLRNIAPRLYRNRFFNRLWQSGRRSEGFYLFRLRSRGELPAAFAVGVPDEPHQPDPVDAETGESEVLDPENPAYTGNVFVEFPVNQKSDTT